MNNILDAIKAQVKLVDGKFEVKEKPDVVKDSDYNTINLERKKVEFEDEKEEGEEDEDEGMGMDDGDKRYEEDWQVHAN